MSEFSKKHPKLHAQLMTYVESGLNPDEIIAQFKKEDENKLPENQDTLDEEFPDEIKLISQALAYRDANVDDINEIHTLLNSCYSKETMGSEAFRIGEAVTLSLIEDLMSDASYKWMIVEAPNGRDVELDGVILGVCCYSTDGVSRCNGVVEGSLGSIRLFGVLPRYHGFCVGVRLLKRAEEKMFKDYNCCRVMVCIPGPRVSMLQWIERRNYVRLGSSSYPFAAVGHTPLTKEKRVDLVQFIKTKDSSLNSSDDADDKFLKVLSLVQTKKNEFSVPSTTTVSETAQSFSGDNVSITADNTLQQQQQQQLAPPGNPTLPPLFRHLSVSSVLSNPSGGNRSIGTEKMKDDLMESDSKTKYNTTANKTNNNNNNDDDYDTVD